MNKLSGVKVGKYEIVNSIEENDDYDYEEMTVEDLLNRENYSEDEKTDFIKQYFAVNIHQFTASESYDKIMGLFQDYKTDPRLAKLNAIVLLSLKKKGRGIGYTSLSQERFKSLVDYAFANGIPLGFDSCSCGKFQKCLNKEQSEKYNILCEPCEAFGIFSSYVNVEGKYFPCSFCEGQGEWKDGIDVVNCNDFTKDVWNHPLVDKYRKLMIKTGRECPMFDI